MNAAANTEFWAPQKEPPPFAQSSVTRDRVSFFFSDRTLFGLAAVT